MATKTLPKIRYDTSWEDEALCLKLGIPTDWFYPDEETRQYEYEHKVVPICERCPVQPQCLDHALRVNEEFAIWGGKKANRRVKIKAKRRAEWPKFLADLEDDLAVVIDLLEYTPLSDLEMHV